MKIDVSKIGIEPVVFNTEYNAALLDMDTSIAHFKKPILALLKVSRDKENVIIKAHLDYAVNFICSRCLSEFHADFHKDFMFSLILTGPSSVDVTPNIREEVVVSFPIKPLCKDGCKGLCPKCGKDLNEGGCNCIK